MVEMSANATHDHDQARKEQSADTEKKECCSTGGEKPEEDVDERQPPGWIPAAAVCAVAVGLASTAAAGRMAGVPGALVVVFATCFVFLLLMAIWFAPGNIAGYVTSITVALVGAALFTGSAWLVAYLAQQLPEGRNEQQSLLYAREL